MTFKESFDLKTLEESLNTHIGVSMFPKWVPFAKYCQLQSSFSPPLGVGGQLPVDVYNGGYNYSTKDLSNCMFAHVCVCIRTRTGEQKKYLLQKKI